MTGIARIRRLSTCGVAVLAVAGFAMSYGALHALARDSAVPAYLAWLWPLVVDGFIVVSSLSVLHAVLEARTARYPWVLLLVFAAVSVAGNVAHSSPTPVGRLVAAVPPVALVLAFDLLMRQLHLSLSPAAGRVVRVPAPAGRSETAPGPSAALQLAGSTVARRVARLVVRRRASGRPVTGPWLAAELDISDGYARRLLRQLDRPANEPAAEAVASR